MTLTSVTPDIAPPLHIDPAPASVSRAWRWSPWALLAAGAALFVYGERSIPNAAASQFGLLAVASPAYGISILVVAAGFVLAIRQASMRAAVAAVILTVVVLRLPRLISTDMPMYAWTYKHIGVVDYIQHSHQLARDVDIYNGWPGLFAVSAWFSELTGMSVFTIAHWFTPIFHLVLVGLVYGTARAWGLKPLTALVSTYFVEALNWVEQDYFAPQATALLFVVVIIGLVGLSVRSGKSIVVLPLLILFAATVITHQLTPYWIMMLVGLLVITGKIRPWWIVIPMSAMLIGFLIFNWQQASEYSLFSADITQNIKSNVPVKGVIGQRITAGGMRGVASAMWLGTAAVLLYRFRKRQSYWALGVVALSPLLLILVQNYGGEVIFRVYLYSVTGCSLVWAPILHKMMQANLRRFWAVMALVLLGTALAAQGSMGSWYANVMPKAQVETSRIVLGQAELPAYLTAVAPVWPERSSWRYVDYARFHRHFDALMVEVPDLAGSHFKTDEEYQRFVEALYGRPDASTYLIITDQMQVYSWYFGILPWDALPNLKEHLRKDTERWEPYYDGQGITVFLHKVDTASINNPLRSGSGSPP